MSNILTNVIQLCFEVVDLFKNIVFMSSGT